MTASPTTAAAIASALACGRSGCPCARAAQSGQGATHCPAHDDGNPSLSVGEKGGRAVVHCLAGCEQSAVIEALRRRGFFDGSEYRNGSTPAETKLEYEYITDRGRHYTHIRLERPGEKKRMWWVPKGVATDTLPLYRAKDVAKRTDELVLILEGEKKTDAAVRAGFLAVSVPGGASQRRFGSALEVLRGRDVVLLPDNDQPGRELMALLLGQIVGLVKSARTLELPGLPDAGDLADWLAAGHTADELRELLQATPAYGNKSRPRILTGLAVLTHELPPVVPVVEGLLGEGCMILAGRPKLGKSWLGGGIGLSVAAGGKALGRLGVTGGDVLWLALEDGERRVQDRIRTMLAGEAMPERLHVAYDWPRLDDGGLDHFEWWLDEHPNARLIIIDTLKRLRPAELPHKRLYDLDYDAVAPLADLAKRRRICVLIVHHTNKSQSDDPMDLISGSTGLTGAVDGAMVLKRLRGEQHAELLVYQRDFGDQSLALRFDEAPFGWQIIGSGDDARRSLEQIAVLRVIALETDESDHGAITSREISQEIGKPAPTIRRLLSRLTRDGLVKGGEHGYRITPRGRASLHTPPITPDQGDHPPPDRPDRPDRADHHDRPDRTSNEALCPNACGVQLRDGWCPICGQQWDEEGS